jgi:hypothetical protein
VNQLLGAPEAIVGEVSATVRFATNKPSTTLVRFGLVGGALDCLGAPCPLLGAPARQATAGSSPLAFEHAVDVTGLTVNERYRVVVSAEDDVGGVATGAIEFLTEPLPKLAVNEVMADPDVTENTAEFIELLNFGDVELDVSGWRVNVTGNSLCTATLGAGATVDRLTTMASWDRRTSGAFGSLRLPFQDLRADVVVADVISPLELVAGRVEVAPLPFIPIVVGVEGAVDAFAPDEVVDDAFVADRITRAAARRMAGAPGHCEWLKSSKRILCRTLCCTYTMALTFQSSDRQALLLEPRNRQAETSNTEGKTSKREISL